MEMFGLLQNKNHDLQVQQLLTVFYNTVSNNTPAKNMATIDYCENN